MKKEIKSLKIASVLHRALSIVLMKSSISSKNILVSNIKLSKDLRKANVYTILSSVNKEAHDIHAVINELNKSAWLIRRGLSNHVNLRIIPELVFKPDLEFNNFVSLNQTL